jgi:hypothetical protein
MWLCPSWAGWVGWVVASSWWVKKSWTLQRLFELSLLVHTEVHTSGSSGAVANLLVLLILSFWFCISEVSPRAGAMGEWTKHLSMTPRQHDFRQFRVQGFVWATVSNLGFLSSRENLSYSIHLWQLLTWDALPFAPAISSYSLLFPDRCFQFLSGIASSCRGSFAILCHPTA